jgi:hypothetical protein
MSSQVYIEPVFPGAFSTPNILQRETETYQRKSFRWIEDLIKDFQKDFLPKIDGRPNRGGTTNARLSSISKGLRNTAAR